MIAATELRLVLVTPETTLLDEPIRSAMFPLFDGQMGILPGRAPLVGRLGTGELRFDRTSGGAQSFFIDGGFVQIKGSVVSILTHAASRLEDIDSAAAQQALADATALIPTTDSGFTDKQHAQDRARRMIALRRGR